MATDNHCAHVLIEATECSASTLFQTIVVTLIVVFFYVLSKSVIDRSRLSRSRVTVVVIGAGPVGLVSALIATRSGRASRVIIFEERDRATLMARSKQITLGTRGVRFLRSSAVGVDVVRGTGATWHHHQCALTMRAGTLLQCLLEAVEKYEAAKPTSVSDGLEEETGSAKGGDGKKISQSPDASTMIDLRLGTKFTRDCLEELENIPGRIVAIVCDGAGGRSASLLGLSDEYSHHSCRAYGATATVDRPSLTSLQSTYLSPVRDGVPPSSPIASAAAAPAGGVAAAAAATTGNAVSAIAAEVRIHNVTIDMLTATSGCCGPSNIGGSQGGGGAAGPAAGERFGSGSGAAGSSRKCMTAAPVTSEVLCGMLTTSSGVHDDPFPTGFHLKIFGESEHRCMALAVPRCESRVVKALKVVADQSSCFNHYKSPSEKTLTESSTDKQMKFSPRLFEIKLSHRMESVAFIEDANIFVVVEGDSARRLNFNAGSDFNLALIGLESLQQFVEQAACADDEQTILNALITKFRHGQFVSEQFIRHGLKEVMFS